MGIANIENVGYRVQRRVTVNGQIQEKTKLFSIKIPVRTTNRTEFRLATAAERKRILEKAKQYDAKLALWQKSLKQGFDPFTPTKKNNTGVRGITRRKHKAHGYVIDAFFVCVADDNNKVHSRYFNIQTLGHKNAWTAAVTDLCSVKKLDKRTRTKLLSIIPEDKNDEGNSSSPGAGRTRIAKAKGADRSTPTN